MEGRGLETEMRLDILTSWYANAVISGLTAVLLLAAPSLSGAGVGSTKHNFGSLSLADVKTSETTEICVFCHTPHHANPEGALWNKEVPGGNYNVYQSTTIVATIGQPTGSSKLCLACHDGTIAIGSMLNLPGKGMGGTLAVTGVGITSGKITSASAGYIGSDLSDDHPISFDYSLSYPSNTEIKDDTTFPSGVKLDKNKELQCTACHDAHGNGYPKFMVASLENGTLCAACHDKRYWDTMPSTHSTSTAVWNGTGENPWHEDMGAIGFDDDTPALQSCLACHRSHGGVSGMSLLKGVNPSTGTTVDEEWTCLNCHNGNVASKDMVPIFDSISSHDVKGTYGLHVPSRETAGDPVRETAANLGLNRHAECADCHNSHGTMDGNHFIGGVNGNIIAPNLLGSWGVKPFPWGAAGNPALTYLVVDFITTVPGSDNLEGYLCIKCHSYYAYGTVPPRVPSGNADRSLVNQSDPTEDFNINNMAFHPVFGQGKNRPPVGANPNWPLNGLGLSNTFRYVDFPGIGARTGFYNVTHDSTITCSDCHSSSSTSDPQGPHGSFNKWILRSNETTLGTLNNFCYDCHRRNVYGDEGFIGAEANFARVTHPVDGLGLNSPFYMTGIDTGNFSNKFEILCLSCHGGGYDSVNNVMKGIHGSNAAAGASGDPLGYRMMNGACVESYTRPSTFTAGALNFRTVDPVADPVCSYNFTNFTIGAAQANYDCNTIADCSN